MEQNNSNIPVVKVGDTIYESSDSYSNLSKRKVERITKTQIILDRGTKLRNDPLKMWGGEEAYYLVMVGKSKWNNTNYYLETEELVAQYKHEQLYLKTKKVFELLDLKKLTDEQLNIILAAISQVELSIEIKSKSINTENKL